MLAKQYIKEWNMNITIRLLEANEIESISKSFEKTVWGPITSLLENYLTEQIEGKRVVLVAYTGNDYVGYVTIKWQSDYPPFAEKGIPEIHDLRVLPAFRRLGIATALVDEAEKRISERSPMAGIGVGLYADYGPAQRMYVLRGYVPDGMGLYYKSEPVKPGQDVRVDDYLVLNLIKEREKKT